MIFEEHLGSHYHMGLRWGGALYRRGIHLLEQVPFPITQTRLDFASACLPHYRRYFPTVLEELQGIADGQHILPAFLHGVLFSMYAMPPGPHCSCFAVLRESGVLWGRNSDFLPHLEEANREVIYRFSGPSYAFSARTTSFAQMEDGINERGLVIGLTSVQPAGIRPGLNAGLLLRLILETCSGVDEALALLSQVPIASAQTFLLADKGGHAALVECCSQGLALRRASQEHPCLWSVNAFHLPEMQALQGLPEDDWASGPRWEVLKRALPRLGASLTLRQAQELLAGRLCPYDRTQGKDTVWSVVCDLGAGTLYRAAGNPSRVPFQLDQRFSF